MVLNPCWKYLTTQLEHCINRCSLHYRNTDSRKIQTLYEGNKKRVVSSPSGICLASPGTFLLTDTREGKLYSARLHYPVDVVELSSSLCTSLGVAFKDGVVYIVDNDNSRITYCGLSGKIAYDPARLTVKELKTVLEDLKLIPADATNLHKADLNSCYRTG